MVKMTPNLKKLRTDQTLSQAFLAGKLGVSRPTYIQIENGKRELTVSEAEKLAKLYNIPIVDFIAGKTVPIPEVKLPKKLARELKKQKKSNSADIRISVPRKKLDVFREILLYILKKVGSKPNVGETVIYKLLYFIDFNYYEKYEEQLIGATYIKNHHGPTPVEFKDIVKQMAEQGEIVPVKSKYFQYDQKKYLPLREPDLGKLSARDIQHIDEILNSLSDKSAKELSDYSHRDVPWISAEEGKIIDYEAVFYRNDEFAQRNHEMDFLDASASDVLEHLPPLSEEEYDYYMSLPDKK